MCGSFAINHNMHGRDGTHRDLCDVCFWKNKAAKLEKRLDILTKTNRTLSKEAVHG